jgi:hypothetical protein
MKNKTGILGGFVLGMGGFLLMFKVIVLDSIPPSDEVPPGFVMLAAIFAGVFFAFVGYLIQRRFGKELTTTESK